MLGFESNELKRRSMGPSSFLEAWVRYLAGCALMGVSLGVGRVLLVMH